MGHRGYRVTSNVTSEQWELLRRASADLTRGPRLIYREFWHADDSTFQLEYSMNPIELGTNVYSPHPFSDFPSLSGAPSQSQAQNQAHLVWANASQRGVQQTPVQRQQHPTSQPPSRGPQTQTQLPQQQNQPSHDDLFPSGSQFANRLDDYRNGGQGISGQLGGGAQPQPGNIDEFPPLGRNVPAEIGQDRRSSLMQGAGFGAFNTNLPFAGVNQSQSAQSRNLMASAISGQERITSPVAAGSTGKMCQNVGCGRWMLTMDCRNFIVTIAS